MWFKKQKKLDPKLRFQSPDFTKRVQVAGRFKRKAKPFPETPLGQLFLRLGLDSVWSRLAVVAGLLVLVYLIYIPNFLYVKTIFVTGVSGDDGAQVQSLAQHYIHTFRFLPQWNLFFLNTEALRKYIIAHDTKIYSVAKIEKKPFHRISITVQTKAPTYIVATPNALITLYNDGTVASNSNLDQHAFDSNTLLKLKQDFTVARLVGDTYVDNSALTSLQLLQSQFQTRTQLLLDFVRITMLQSPSPVNAPDVVTTTDTIPTTTLLPTSGEPDWREMVVYARKQGATSDFTILVDSKLLSTETLDNLKLLMNSLNSAQQNTLYYIDMRFGSKGYVCFVNSACSQPPPAATASPASPTPLDPTNAALVQTMTKKP